MNSSPLLRSWAFPSERPGLKLKSSSYHWTAPTGHASSVSLIFSICKWSSIHSFIHQVFISTYYVPGTFLAAGGKYISKQIEKAHDLVKGDKQ